VQTWRAVNFDICTDEFLQLFWISYS
jgi:hypothetical protein